MVKFFRVKEKARGLARQQKFEQALAEYRSAIARAEADGDTSALRNLYNAAGDASLQRNDAAAAVDYFEKAADLYLNEGLYDNAIALCHKILRHVPTKAEAYARLGRIYAEKGLRNESIQNWLEFAERRQKASDLSSVTAALREVVTLAPESDSVRMQLADVLVTRGEAREALAELLELWRRAGQAQDVPRVAELEDRIARLRSDHGIPEEPAAPEAAPVPAGGERGPAAETSRVGKALAGKPADLGEPPPLAIESFQEQPGREPAAPREAGALPGLESGFGFSTAAPSIAPPGTAGEGAGAAPGAEGVRAPGGEPSLEPPAEARPPGAGAPPAPQAPPETEAPRRKSAARQGARPRREPVPEKEQEELPPVGALPGFTAPEAPAAPVPVLEPAAAAADRSPIAPGIAPIAFVPVEERIVRAEARLARNPDDAEERIYLGELYQESGAIDLARAAMAQGASELLEAGQTEKAWRAYRRLVALAPDEIEVVQKLVDVAQASGGGEMLLQSYELLGDRLMEEGQYARAAEIHRRILEIDPAHRHSQDQLLLLEGLDPRAQAAEAGRGHDGRTEAEYVDLARLVTDGDVGPRADTRMTARAQPTGDEEADLQSVIEAFRQGVELNIEEGDYESHYDLGVAFRQMGLLDEAVREFQLAARGAEHREQAFELMGLCFMEKGMVSVAVNCFRRGIEGERDPHQALGLHYHLARSLEELGQVDAAREEYERVVALDVRFLDAAERLQGLS